MKNLQIIQTMRTHWLVERSQKCVDLAYRTYARLSRERERNMLADRKVCLTVYYLLFNMYKGAMMREV